jgi:CRISPR-associated protein Csm4
MKLFTYQFHLRSPVITPFDADTWFGHAAWAWRYLKGEPALADWMQTLNDHPVVFSDSFPDGMLPCPFLPPLSREQSTHWISQYFGESMPEQIIGIDALRQLKKCRFIPLEVLKKSASNLSQFELTNELMALYKGKGYEPTFGSPTTSLILHNAINRQTGTVKEFFGTSELVYSKDMLKFHGYIASDSWDKDDLTEIFQYIEHSGFGADKSTGRGAIQLESIEEAEPFLTPDANAVMSLSLGLPGPELGIDASYRIRVKFGKLGGHFATMPKPFKKPIMMMEAGAVFPISNPPMAIPLYLSDVHYHPDVIHHAGMILYPLHLKEAA